MGMLDPFESRGSWPRRSMRVPCRPLPVMRPVEVMSTVGSPSTNNHPAVRPPRSLGDRIATSAAAELPKSRP